ncbi:AMP-binding protein [Corallococcus carmarthensis]|uniref:AMP-binding protein n=1 Tax=Corallococcus carmarthensis TaxID=2316728 RepID=UPI00148D6EB5|nr:AMP-binding protein [Corallococcus carmarthensis]NOK15689.1 AMP-binding protein [Corallococcus carmarthensis]
MLLSDFLLQHGRTAPERDALVHDGVRWDHARLAAEVARYRTALAELGLGRGDRVVSRMEADPDAIALLIATMALGAAYVPVAPELPPARFEAILARLEPAAVVVSSDLRDAPGVPPGTQVGPLVVARTAHPVSGDTTAPGPEDAAYIIMTSGSTGQPKGIVMTHGAAVNTLRGFSELGVPSSARVGTISPLHFDFAMFDVGMALGNGATLVQVPRMLAYQPRGLVEYLDEHRVTQMHSVPSVWRPLLTEGDASLLGGLRHLDTILYAAESFPAKDVHTLQGWRPDLRIVQCFGHSESIGCCFKTFANPAATFKGRLSLGVALRGTEMFALDEAGREIGVGEEGELYVRGPHLFRGYWRDEAQTRQRLVPDPRTGEGAVFRSGDVVTRDEQGEFYFIGRLDHQVKVGGNRVELSEIEHVVEGDPDVAAAVAVVPADEARATLTCFVVVRGSTPWNELMVRLRSRMSAAMPRYMVPRHLRRLESFPVLSNGKVDRLRLAQMAAEPEAPAPLRTPRNPSLEVP